MELTATHTKLESVRMEVTNTKVDLATKLDGKSFQHEFIKMLDTF